MENKYLNALLDKKKVEEAVSEKRMGKLPYEHYAHLFKDFEPEDIVSRTGVPFIKDAEGGYFDVPLMNDTYRVYWPSGNVDALEGAVPDYKTFVILLRWLENKKAGGARIPQNLSYKEIPGGAHYYGSYEGRVLKRSAFTFAKPEMYEGLERAAEVLDGGKSDQGDFSIRFRFLPDTYLTLILWNGDDEFPPDAQILYDSDITDAFDAEDLAVMGDLFIPRLRAAAVMR